MTDITLQESSRLVELEKQVDLGLQTTHETIEALIEIRAMFKGRWESLGYKTFEEYCRRRFNISDSRARQLIGGHERVKRLATVTSVTAPASEWQTRPLTKLEPGQQPAAWERAVEIADGEQPTAKQVEQAVVEILPPTKRVRVVYDLGMQYADMAIAQLERIHRKDIHRTAALQKVKDWIINNEN